jgi:hypothetical protein
MTIASRAWTCQHANVGQRLPPTAGDTAGFQFCWPPRRSLCCMPVRRSDTCDALACCTALGSPPSLLAGTGTEPRAAAPARAGAGSSARSHPGPQARLACYSAEVCDRARREPAGRACPPACQSGPTQPARAVTVTPSAERLAGTGNRRASALRARGPQPPARGHRDNSTALSLMLTPLRSQHQRAHHSQSRW